MTRPSRGTRLLNRSLMHAAAKLHYVEGLSQLEVSRRMQVSTATVSRLLARAREEGIVRIQVIDLDETDEIGDRLRQHLGLRTVRVLETGQIAALASQVGTLLTGANLQPGAVIAVGWGRTVQGIINARLPTIPDVVVVPATGGIHETATHFQINEFVRAAAEQMQGVPGFLHAPSLPSAELRSVLLRDPDTRRILGYWSQVDAAIVGIGTYRPGDMTPEVHFPGDDADRVVGDVVRHYFDETGQEVAWTGQTNLMAIGRDQLSRVPLSIGVAAGADKFRAILGAARSGMINALVTETRAALRLLDHLEADAEEDSG